MISSAHFVDNVGHPETAISVPQTVRHVLPLFQQNKGQFLTDTLQYLYEETTKTHFYAIHRDDQQVTGDLDATKQRYTELKARLLWHMGYPGAKIVEVVGNSTAYSLLGTQRAWRFLEAHLPIDAIWLYGYTAQAHPDGTKCVNGTVADLIERKGHGDKTLGALVAYHSLHALEEGGWGGALLPRYLLIYGDDETNDATGTHFGEDITTSDFLADKLLLLDGGIQSFRQACNFFLLEKPIVSLSNLQASLSTFQDCDLRTWGDSDFGDSFQPSECGLFSASGFLQFLRRRAMANPEFASEEWLEAEARAYFETHLFGDPAKTNLAAKQKAFNDAWRFFKQHKLYEKLHFLD